MGFPIVSAILVIERPALDAVFLPVGNTPEAYQASFSDVALSRRCPVLARLKTLGHPFSYDQSLFVHDGVADLWDHQAQYGYKTGIAMAMHMPGGRHFLLGVDRPDPLPGEDETLTRMMADLQLLGAYAQETAVRILMPEAGIGEIPELTSRELEVLRWTQDGKSAGVIADLLNINIGTVNYHLQRAGAKLGVSGKHQAVVKALKLGLL